MTAFTAARNTLTAAGDDTIAEFKMLVRLGDSAAEIVANIPELGFVPVVGIGYVAPRYGSQGKTKSGFSSQGEKFLKDLAASL